MVSYYNRMAMYRQQCQLNGGSGQFHNGSSPTSWYNPYHHPNTQVHPPQQYLNCVQDADGQQMQVAWPHPHSVFTSEFFDYNYLQQQQQQQQHLQQRTDMESQLPSPPMSSSEMSSPGAPGGSITPPQHGRPAPVRSPYDWITKPSYQTQPNPGKTRTKDKYRVVYTDHQRLELEKEFHFSRYITIRRKTELAANLGLSERQVKIWFQNRRAKERKQVKKREELKTKEDLLNSTNTVMHLQNLQHPQMQPQHIQMQPHHQTASSEMAPVLNHHQAQLPGNHHKVIPTLVPLM